MEGKRGKSKLQTWEHLIIGGVSGACAASATMPLDLAKTSIQCGVNQPVHKVLLQTVRLHGPGGLFRGMVSAFSCDTAWNCMHAAADHNREVEGMVRTFPCNTAWNCMNAAAEHKSEDVRHGECVHSAAACVVQH